MRLWYLGTGLELRQFKGHTGQPDGIAFTPDGRHLLSAGGNDRTLRMWDVDTGNEVRRFEGHTDRIWDVSGSPDGKRLLSAASDRIVRLADVSTSRVLHTFHVHTAPIRL